LEIGKMADTYPQGRVVPKITWRMQKEIIEVDGSTDKELLQNLLNQCQSLIQNLLEIYE
jgi:hypothetical protein